MRSADYLEGCPVWKVLSSTLSKHALGKNPMASTPTFNETNLLQHCIMAMLSHHSLAGAKRKCTCSPENISFVMQVKESFTPTICAGAATEWRKIHLIHGYKLCTEFLKLVIP